MVLKAQFNEDAIRRHARAHFSRIEQAIIYRLAYLGEQCVNYARSVPLDIGFGDVTGNLRSSIGYIVFAHGRQVSGGDFKPVKEGAEGAERGRSLAAQIASKYESGYVLVVVAGMNYATYVESMGRDVLTGATRFAEEKIPELLQQLNNNIPNH